VIIRPNEAEGYRATEDYFYLVIFDLNTQKKICLNRGRSMLNVFFKNGGLCKSKDETFQKKSAEENLSANSCGLRACLACFSKLPKDGLIGRLTRKKTSFRNFFLNYIRFLERRLF
jgi:hypothetical protein